MMVPLAMTGEHFLSGGGDMGARIRATDWSSTSLGPITRWPETLRSALSICLGSRFPIAIYWGEELSLLYNDAWSPIAGSKHPAALGRGAREVWPEIWSAIGPLFDQVWRTGESTYAEDSLLLMNRHGYTEECYFNFTFTPIRGSRGQVEGVFNAVIETTYRVLNERRSRVLRDLDERISAATSAAQACQLCAASLASARRDVSFCAVYLLDEGNRTARLQAVEGLAAGSPGAPTTLTIASTESPWPLGRALESGKSEVVVELAERLDVAPPGGEWPEPAHSAFVVPITMDTGPHTTAFLILGASPRRALDGEYALFADRAAALLRRVLSDLATLESERGRAEELAELDRVKTAFFSNVSHEFRTPITLILGHLDTLLTTSEAHLGPADRTRLTVVQRNSQRLMRLVNALLDFARIEAGRAQACYQPTHLAELTADLASNFRAACELAGLRLTVDCPATHEPAYVDREMWEKIVLNLVSNAFKFTFDGEISVRLRQLEQHFELSVSDTGTGIPATELPRMFERFHRIEGARGRSHEGSGIGLALIQELARLHRGTIEVRSVLGEGSTFVVRVPRGSAHLPTDRVKEEAEGPTAVRAQAHVDEALSWLPSDAPVPSAPTPSGAHRVLLADDNADLRAYVRDLLAEHFQVETVADGVAALAAARARRPDLIISDVMMPRLDGFGLIRELRGDPVLRDMPILLLSARAGEEARVEGLERGADDYLVKPFSARELLVRVATMLQLGQWRRQSLAQQRREIVTLMRLNELSSRLSGTRGLSEGLDEILTATIELMGADMGNVQVFDPQRKTLTITAHQGFQPDFLNSFREVTDQDPTACGRALRARARVVIEDVERDELSAPLRPIARAAGYRAVQSTPLLARDGRLLGMVSTHFRSPHQPSENNLRWLDIYVRQAADFIERSRSEESLRASEERYRRLLGLLPAAVYTCAAPDGIITFYNDHATRLWGRAPAIGDTDERFCGSFRLWRPDGTPLPHDQTPMALAVRSGRSFRNEEVIIERPDGSRITVLVNIDPIRAADGSIAGAINVFHDTTALRKAQEALQEADRRKDEFIATLSHELRNPLAPLRNALRLMRADDSGAGPDLRIREMMERQVNHLVRLVDDLLEISRVSRGDFELQREPIEVATFVRAALETSEPQIREARHELIVALPKESLWVDGDPVRLAQIVANLINNAARYTAPGGRISVTAQRRDDEVDVAVRDNGAGIAPEVLPHMFEMFNRGSSSNLAGRNGLGIGLALARRLAEMHGGRLDGYSEGPSKGSEVTLRLPLVIRMKQAVAKAENEMITGVALRRILVVDDNHDAADSLAMILSHLGADVRVAHDGSEALDLFPSYDPDVVLLDIGMPDIDGYEVARRIREGFPERRPMLVALTGWGQENDRQRARAAGFDHHLVKPADIDSLQQLLADVPASSLAEAN